MQRSTTNRRRPAAFIIALVVSTGLIAAACGSDDENAATQAPNTTDTAEASDGCFAEPDLAAVTTDGATTDGRLTLVTHDSFAVSEGILEAFTAETGIEVEVLMGGDGGTLVNQAVLAGDNPVGDVLFGIDNTFLCVGLENDVFLPYTSPGLADVDTELQIDPHQRVTPIDYGDVCANYWSEAYDGATPPASLDDLIDPAHADEFVTQNPESSTPGLAFLLATIARYGEEGWEAYWQSLFDNGATVTEDWETAYYGEFIAGGGERPVVTSYASSPAAEVLFADPPVDVSPTEVITETCYRQIEFAGVLRGTDQPAEAALLIDFLLSPTFQEDIPLNMFVYPASGQAELPPVFVDHAAIVDDAVTLDAELVAAERNNWTERWTELRRG